MSGLAATVIFVALVTMVNFLGDGTGIQEEPDKYSKVYVSKPEQPAVVPQSGLSMA